MILWKENILHQSIWVSTLWILHEDPWSSTVFQSTQLVRWICTHFLHLYQAKKRQFVFFLFNWVPYSFAALGRTVNFEPWKLNTLLGQVKMGQPLTIRKNPCFLKTCEARAIWGKVRKLLDGVTLDEPQEQLFGHLHEHSTQKKGDIQWIPGHSNMVSVVNVTAHSATLGVDNMHQILYVPDFFWRCAEASLGEKWNSGNPFRMKVRNWNISTSPQGVYGIHV